MKILKILFPAVLALVLWAALPASARGAEYIYKLKDDAVMPLSLENDSDYLAFGMYTTDDEEMLKKLSSEGLLEFYEPNNLVYLQETPSDPYYMDANTGQITYEYALTNAAAVVNNPRYDASGVKIAILDSGIAQNHPDINYDKIVAKKNVYADTDDVTDTIGHGTSVAGIVAAATDNAVGTASLAHGADLIIVKVFPDGSSSTKIDYILKGIKYALSQNCDVINLSVGTKEYSEALKVAAEAADAQSVILVASSGNHNSETPNDPAIDSPAMYPAALDSTISVGAVDSDAKPSDFSYHNKWVDVTACGTRVWLLGSNSSVDDGYRRSNGTSFAAPFVTAVAAIMKQIDPTINRSRFLEYIKETATDMGAVGRDTFYGYGIINVGKMLDFALGANITATPLFHDTLGNFDVQTTVTNNGFDTYSLKSIWFMDSGNGQTNRKSASFTLAPGESLSLSYLGYGQIYNMLWFKDSLGPVLPKRQIGVVLDLPSIDTGNDSSPTPPDSGETDIEIDPEPILPDDSDETII